MPYADILPPIRETKKYRGLFQRYRDICVLENIDLSESIRCLMSQAIEDYDKS